MAVFFILLPAPSGFFYSSSVRRSSKTVQGGLPLFLGVVGAGLNLPANSCDQILADGRVILGGVSFPVLFADIIVGGASGWGASPRHQAWVPRIGPERFRGRCGCMKLVLPRRSWAQGVPGPGTVPDHRQASQHRQVHHKTLNLRKSTLPILRNDQAIRLDGFRKPGFKTCSIPSSCCFLSTGGGGTLRSFAALGRQERLAARSR